MQINVHKIDNSRIEVRIIHEIEPVKQKKRFFSRSNRRAFKLNAYFFIPNRLARGSNDEFEGGQPLAQSIIFPKVQRKNYYNIFMMNLEGILDTENELSPLTRLERQAQEVILAADRVLYELPVLCCVAKNACSNARKTMIQRIRSRGSTDAIRKEIERELKQLNINYLKVQKRLEQLGERYLNETTRDIQTVYRWALEDFNHQILDSLLYALRVGEHHCFSGEFARFLQEELELQWLYQKQHGFFTLSDDEYHNESYLFHQRELKAWRYSGFAMSSAVARSRNVLDHFWFSMASAIAMIFALGVTISTAYYYGQWSTPFLFFAVLGYMFKDRIKEILRRRFSDKFGNYQLLRLYDPRSQGPCGSIRESLDTCESVPAEIMTLRNFDKNPLSHLYNEEAIIVYREILKLNSIKLFQTHKRLQSGCQILEFNLLPYLQNIKGTKAKQLWRPRQQPQNLETPSQNEAQNNAEPNNHQSYEKIKIKRSYHVTLIIQAASSDGQETGERYRIVVRENRIAWIEKVV